MDIIKGFIWAVILSHWIQSCLLFVLFLLLLDGKYKTPSIFRMAIRCVTDSFMRCEIGVFQVSFLTAFTVTSSRSVSCCKSAIISVLLRVTVCLAGMYDTDKKMPSNFLSHCGGKGLVKSNIFLSLSKQIALTQARASFIPQRGLEEDTEM